MIVTLAHVKIQPSKREEFLAAVPPFLAATRKETGCIVYDLVECVGDDNHFITVERWEERAQVDAHMGLPHTQAFLGVVGGAAAAPPTIEIFNVSSVDKVM